MQIERRFSNDLAGPWADIALVAHPSDKGDVLAPSHWSAIQVDALASMLARGVVPSETQRIPEDGVPEFLWPSRPAPGASFSDEGGLPQLIERIAGALTHRAWKAGTLASESCARAFLDDMTRMMAQGMAAPVAGLWDGFGLAWAYGAEEPARPDTDTTLRFADDAPLMAPLQEADRARAALMRGAAIRKPGIHAVCDVAHPEARRFIDWKLDEERKLSALIAGSRMQRDRLAALAEVARTGTEPALSHALREARRAMIPETQVQRVLDHARQGFASTELPVFDDDWDGEGWASVTGQQTECTLRLGDGFLRAMQDGDDAGLWDRIGDAAWATGDPALEFTDNMPPFAGRADLSAHLYLPAFCQGGQFDHQGLAHATRLTAIAQHAADPQADHLAIGPVGLGAVLMSMGLAYGSDEAQELATELCAVIAGAAWESSARIAACTAEGTAFGTHRRAMLRMLSDRADERGPAQAIFGNALALAQASGLRHGQVCAVRPSGDLRLLLGWEADGIEPLQALVHHVPDADGAHRRVIAPAVAAGLGALGYPTDAIARIATHATGHGTLLGSPEIGHAALAGHGFGHDQIDRIEAALPDAFDIRFVFNQWTLGQEFCRDILGIPQDRLDDPGFDMLAHLGFSARQIQAANAHVCGAMTVEGAPDLDPADLAVFDCAQAVGRSSTRRVHPEASIRLTAAVQHALSGDVQRRTVVPHATGIAQIQSLFELAHDLGLWHCRIQREGSRLAAHVAEVEDDILPDAPAPVRAGALAERMAERIVVKEAARSDRRKLPQRRKGYTQKASVGGHKVYLRTGEYDDGSVGEIFIDMHKEGAAFRAMMNNFAIAVSVALQYGVPLEEFVDAFTFTRFEPAGPVEGNDSIKTATSVLDYVFRELAVSYLDRTDLAHVKPEGARFDDLGGGRAEGRRTPERPEPKSLTMLKQISSAGYLRKRLPQELMVLQGRASLRHHACSICGEATSVGSDGAPHCPICDRGH
ncbi:ribonucleotide-diphosphate reductase subunit alpha [Paracoccus zeaxanthinifaciens]|uniref:TSCPD domain-containing protein n=1 Tax=Paracoccus zeaxanthinifaciens TaxID=187400 RepID=UPI0003B675CA|nr:ribonucleotide-diphosphate reductase subunit alpha [Paracoccus zeaxanthinifaciens]